MCDGFCTTLLSEATKEALYGDVQKMPQEVFAGDRDHVEETMLPIIS